MFVQLFAYILIWLAVFALLCAGILWLAPRVNVAFLKAMARRLEGEGPPPAAGSLQPLEVFARLGAIAAASGALLLLLTAPASETSSVTRWQLILAEAVCAVVIIWQVRVFREKMRARPAPRR